MQILSSFSNLPDRFGVFGGTFDPVQNAHIALVRYAHKECGVKAIVCIPNRRNPLKGSRSEACDEHRIRMLEIAFEVDPFVYLSKIELNRSLSDVSFTVDTLKEIRSECGDRKIVFLGGSDLIASLANWKDPEAIFELVDECIIVERTEGDNKGLEKIASAVSQRAFTLLKTGYKKSNRLLGSATEVRDRIRQGQDVSHLVPPAVASYIRKNSLYLA